MSRKLINYYFFSLIKGQPSILHQPELQFFKEYLESIGGVVPAAEGKPKCCPEEHHHQKEREVPSAAPPSPPDEPELVESDIELDMEGVIGRFTINISVIYSFISFLHILFTIAADNDPPQEMGDSSKEVELSEADEDKLMAIKQEATDAFASGDYQKAVDKFTEAILMNPQSALMFAKRANAFLHLKKPNAAIRDCNKAVEMNPDSATAHKFRGRAHR